MDPHKEGLPEDLAKPVKDNSWIAGALIVGVIGGLSVVALIYGTGLISGWW